MLDAANVLVVNFNRSRSIHYYPLLEKCVITARVESVAKLGTG
jgi:hypothetical protein